jgi:hypothetical protein
MAGGRRAENAGGVPVMIIHLCRRRNNPPETWIRGQRKVLQAKMTPLSQFIGGPEILQA